MEGLVGAGAAVHELPGGADEGGAIQPHGVGLMPHVGVDVAGGVIQSVPNGGNCHIGKAFPAVVRAAVEAAAAIGNASHRLPFHALEIQRDIRISACIQVLGKHLPLDGEHFQHVLLGLLAGDVHKHGVLVLQKLHGIL